MKRIQDFYDSHVASLEESDFLSQVCHTLGGKPLAPEIIALSLADLRGALGPGPDDHVLDLCCGNGLFSKRLADTAATVTGIDFSSQMVRIANTHHGAGNIRYIHGDITRLDDLDAIRDRRYSRVVINAGLQHFHPGQFGDILGDILALTDDAPVLVFTYVPENGKQKFLFNSLRKRLKRLWLRATGRDIFGHWWDRRIFEEAARRHGLACSFPPIDPRIHYAGYRMNVRLSKAAG